MKTEATDFVEIPCGMIIIPNGSLLEVINYEIKSKIQSVNEINIGIKNVIFRN